MEYFIKKIIRASAGTGKTYRLSLEYIAVLIRFRQAGAHFGELLVITFTKKATAEIRERIFTHLELLFQDSDESRILRQNLIDILGAEPSDEDLAYLRQVYHEMLVNKNLVQISTIDSFVNNIFKTVISPFLGLTTYDIDNTSNEELLEEIYEFILGNQKNLDKIKSLFRRTGKKRIEDYEQFVKSILDKRWVFHLIREMPVATLGEEALAELAEKQIQPFLDCLQKFVQYLYNQGIQLSPRDIFKRNFFELFFRDNPPASFQDIVEIVKVKLKDAEFLRRHYKSFLKGETFWNGSKLLRKDRDKPFAQELKEDVRLASQELAVYLLYKELVPEQEEIRQIAELVFQKYDEIKFREKRFTYNDIAYYTFKYLYDPSLSLIEKGFVTNAFYEVLANTTRFILIDEFQDTNIIQFKILLPIIKEIVSGMGIKNYGGVIIVGDEKQSIYGWRGGERDLLLRTSMIMEQPQEITLDTSYRSDQRVIDFINRVFMDEALHEKLKEQQIHWPYQRIRAHRANEAGYVQVQFRNFSDSGKDTGDMARKEDTMREFVLRTLYPKIERNEISLKDTAILTRKNDDLGYMAEVLDELGVPYVLESSSSILKHRTIKPMMYLLEYIVYQDMLDLLKFLRSDYVLLNTTDLKKVLVACRAMAEGDFSSRQLFSTLNDIPAIRKVSVLLSELDGTNNEKAGIRINSLLNFVRKILDEYHVTKLFPLENDIKNINRFLEIVAQFQSTSQDYPGTLKGFLDYCEDYGEDEELVQVGLKDVDAVNLLSIHKSKGLEFDNVFLYWNLSARAGQARGQLQHYLKYEPDFSAIEDFALTFNYDDVLSQSPKQTLSQAKAVQQAIEELNTLYVAITRARTNIFLYFAYKKAGGFEKIVDDVADADDAGVDRILARTLYTIARSEFTIRSDDTNYLQADFGRFVPIRPGEEKEMPRDFAFVRQYINPDRTSFLQKDEERVRREEHLDFKKTFLVNRDIDRGNVAHYYLAFIKYASSAELTEAAERTIAHYGTLFTAGEIEHIIRRVNEFIQKNRHLFDKERWAKVFTEYTLYDPSGREVRIDRLMVDEAGKEILIVDYKTGSVYEEFQIENYVRTLQSVPFVQANHYQVRGEYVEVDIS